MRTADYERWHQFDFVVGIKVELSNNHTCRGVKGEFVDICDELAGEYPKDFKFVGWHPHCRCHAVPILKTPEEMMADNERIMRGEEPSEETESENVVRIPPKQFYDWVKGNEERAKTAYSIPYFVRDNTKYLSKEAVASYGSKRAYESFADYELAMKNNRRQQLSKELKQNIAELNKVMPVQQGQMMQFGQADRGHVNPDFTASDSEGKGFRHNCQTCTMAYELRRRGFDVHAKPNPVFSGKWRDFDVFCYDRKTSYKERFLELDGSPAIPLANSSDNSLLDTIESKYHFISNNTNKIGRYEVEVWWKGSKEGHVFIVEHQNNGNVVWYDPQSARISNRFDDYLEKMKSDDIKITRIDDKLINPSFARRFLRY